MSTKRTTVNLNSRHSALCWSCQVQLLKRRHISRLGTYRFAHPTFLVKSSSFVIGQPDGSNFKRGQRETCGITTEREGWPHTMAGQTVKSHRGNFESSFTGRSMYKSYGVPILWKESSLGVTFMPSNRSSVRTPHFMSQETRRNVHTSSVKLWLRPKPNYSLPLPAVVTANRVHKFSSRANSSVELRPAFDRLPPILQSVTPVREQLAMWQQTYGTRNVDELEKMSLSGGPSLSQLGRGTDDANDFREPAYSEGLDALKEQPNEFGSLEEDLATRLYLKPGALIELTSHMGNHRVLSVFCREIDGLMQLYTAHGKWVHIVHARDRFVIHDFIHPEWINRILPYLPDQNISPQQAYRARVLENDVPRSASAPIIDKMNVFLVESNTIYRKNATRLDNAHKLLANPINPRFESLDKIAKTLLYKNNSASTRITGPELYSVYKALTNTVFGFATDRYSIQITDRLLIRPTEQVEIVSSVRAWVRDFQEWMAKERISPSGISQDARPNMGNGAQLIHDFILKARVLVKESRKSRQSLKYASVGPSSMEHTSTDPQDPLKTWNSLKFTSEESSIIKFLENAAVNTKFSGEPELAGLALSIVRFANTAGSEGTTGLAQIFEFLQEIGVLLPWENRLRFDEHYPLPSCQRTYPSLRGTFTESNAITTTTLIDTMKDLRKDWGEQSVFCIDNIGAQEIDDGISLERIDGRKELWVHVHIANPTAFLEVTHPISRMAAGVVESVYFPEKNWPMLPPLVSQYFSLHRDRPVLTFSMLLDSQGALVDKKIQNGIIRNVTHLNPDQLNSVSGFADARKRFRLAVGNVPETTPPQPSDLPQLTSRQIEDLQTLEDLAWKRFKHREALVSSVIQENELNVSICTPSTRARIPVLTPSRKVARFSSGDPAIEVYGKEYTSTSTHCQDRSRLVTEMMLLCCEAAATWARERRLPIPYRGTVKNPHLQSQEKLIEQYMKAFADSNQPIPLLLTQKLLRHIGRSVMASDPLHHGGIHVRQYAKVTSPLRRFGDMVCHWQIEAALREEARIGRSLATSNGEPLVDEAWSWLAFSRQEIDSIIGRLLPREKRIGYLKANSQTHWIYQAFYRAFYFGESKLEDTYEFLADGFSTTGAIAAGNQICVPGKLLPFGLDCFMYEPKSHGFGWDGKFGSGDPPSDSQIEQYKDISGAGGFGWRTGDRWKVAIQVVSPYLRTAFVKPLELISRELPIE